MTQQKKKTQQIKGWLQTSRSLQIISASCCPPDFVQQVTWNLPELLVLILFWQPLHIFAGTISHMATKSRLSFSQHARVSSACLTKPAKKKCVQSIFSAVWQWEYKIIGSSLFFVPQSHIFQPFQQSAPRKRRLSIAAKHRICNRYRTTPSN